MDAIRVMPFCAGSISAMEALGIPLSKALGADESVSLLDGELPAPLQAKPIPTNFLTAIGGVVGVVIIVEAGKWLAGKLLDKGFDEFYQAVLRPKVANLFSSAEVKELSVNSKKKWLYQVCVWYEEYGAGVLLTLVGNSYEEVLQQEHLIRTVHSQAVDWLVQHGAEYHVHLYICECGKVNVKPIELSGMKEAQAYLERLWPMATPVPSLAEGVKCDIPHR